MHNNIFGCKHYNVQISTCLYITAEQVCSAATLQLYQTIIILLSLIVFIENGLIVGVLGILLLSKKSKLHKMYMSSYLVH